MSSAPIQTHSFGPFVKGLVDTWPEGVDGNGVLRRAEGVYLWGAGRLRSMPLPMAEPSLLRNAATTNVVTNVEAVIEASATAAGDNPIFFAVGFQADTTGPSPRTLHVHQSGPTAFRWSDLRTVAGVIGQIATNATLLGTLSAAQAPAIAPWTTVARSPRVTVAAVNTVLHIAANVLGGFYQTYDCATAVVAAPPGPVLVRGIFTFQRHLWGYGGANPTDGAVLYFGTPDYGPLNAGSSLTLPDAGGRITDIIGVMPLNTVAVVCTTDSAFLLSGYGSNTWQTSQVTGFGGVAGERAMASDLTAAYALATDGLVWRMAPDGATPLPPLAALSAGSLAIAEATLAVDRENQWLLVSVPIIGTATPLSRLFVYDIGRAVWISGGTTLGCAIGAAARLPNNYPLRPYLGAQVIPPKGPPLAVSVTPTVGGGTVAWTPNSGATAALVVVDIEIKRTADGASAWEVYYCSLGTGAEASPQALVGLGSGISYDMRMRYRTTVGYTSEYTTPITWTTL